MLGKFWSKGEKEAEGNPSETEVFDAEFSPVQENTLYTGVVKSSHERYCFIGSVRRGTETVRTNGDVFCPVVFPKDAIVQFDELNGDPERSSQEAGPKFRTESARIVEGGLVQLTPNMPVVSAKEYLIEVSRRQSYHVGFKDIDPVEVEKAAGNGPFAEILGIHAYNQQHQVDTTEIAEEFLRSNFHNLSSIDVSYTIQEEVDKEREKGIIKTAVEDYHNSGMDGIANSIEEEYRKFVGIRDAFRLMKINDLLTIESIIPKKYIADFTVVAPIMFIRARNESHIFYPSADRNVAIDPLGRMLCDWIGTREYAWFYQIYNKRPRPLSSFGGRDIMPRPLLNIYNQAKETFDYLAFFTPYHDLAGQEWMAEGWARNRDPFMIGFMRDMDHMFVLGRWISHGLFPLVCDMIADTMSHLRLHKSHLKNFNVESAWYFGTNRSSLSSHFGWLGGKAVNLKNGNMGNELLEPFANEVLQAYEKGRLFQYLRGEKPAVKEAAA